MNLNLPGLNLTNWQVAAVILVALAIWTAVSSVNMLGTMRQGGTPNTPQAALGQAAITGSIGCLTVLVVALSIGGAFYLNVRHPTLPFPGLYVRLVPAEAALSPQSFPPFFVGGEAEVVADEGVPMFRADEAGQPTDMLKAQLWQGQVMTVIAGPSDQGGRYQWRVRTRDGVEGWVPVRTLSGRPALAPR